MAGGQVRRVSWPSWRVDVTVSFDSITTATSQKEEAAVVTRFIIFSSSHPAATIKCLPTPPTPCITRLTGRVNHPPPEESTNSRILLGVKKKNCRSFNPNVVVLAFKYAPTHMSTDVHFIVGRLDASFPPKWPINGQKSLLSAGNNAAMSPPTRPTNLKVVLSFSTVLFLLSVKKKKKTAIANKKWKYVARKKKERACDGHCRPGASLASSGFSRELGQRSHLTSSISKNVERERDVCNHNGAAKTEGSVPTRKKGTKQKILKINYQRDGRENVRHKKKEESFLTTIAWNCVCARLFLDATSFLRKQKYLRVMVVWGQRE